MLELGFGYAGDRADDFVCGRTIGGVETDGAAEGFGDLDETLVEGCDFGISKVGREKIESLMTGYS